MQSITTMITSSFAASNRANLDFPDTDAGRSVAFYIETRHALSTIAITHSDNLCATGSTKGIVVLYDAGSCCPRWLRSVRMKPGYRLRLGIATCDGLPSIVGLSSEGSEVKVIAEQADAL